MYKVPGFAWHLKNVSLYHFRFSTDKGQLGLPNSDEKLSPKTGEFAFKTRYFYQSRKKDTGASLVVQWLRICLPMQGTRVRALVWEDPTCRGATRPMSHNC